MYQVPTVSQALCGGWKSWTLVLVLMAPIWLGITCKEQYWLCVEIECISYLLLYNKLLQTWKGLNNAYLLSHSFHGSAVWAWFSWLLCSVSHKTAVKVLAGLCSHLEAQPRKNLPRLFKLLAKFMSSWLHDWGPWFLLLSPKPAHFS